MLGEGIIFSSSSIGEDVWNSQTDEVFPHEAIRASLAKGGTHENGRPLGRPSFPPLLGVEILQEITEYRRKHPRSEPCPL